MPGFGILITMEAERLYATNIMRLNFTMLIASGLLLFAGCGAVDKASDGSPTRAGSASVEDSASEPPSSSPTPSAEPALRTAVQGYSDLFLAGDIKSYDAYFSNGCKAKVDRNYFLGMLMAVDQYGGPKPISTFDATIDGTAADVSYTFDELPLLNQEHETWVLEDRKWKTTDCPAI